MKIVWLTSIHFSLNLLGKRTVEMLMKIRKWRGGEEGLRGIDGEMEGEIDIEKERADGGGRGRWRGREGEGS